MKKLKLFEQFLSKSEYYEFFSHRDRCGFTSNEIEAIRKIVGIINQIVGTFIKFKKEDFNYKIDKFEDEWFLVRKWKGILDVLPDDDQLIHFYKCDQFDEVIKYLKSL